MGKPMGFCEIARRENPWRPEEERMGDFRALHTALPPEARREQAARCMNCGVPFCQSDFGCPLHNRIPEWNDLLYRGEIREAFERLIHTASFPEFTGRVCPALCEKACMLAETDGAVTTRDDELYLIEEGFRRGWMQSRIPRERTGRSVAVVGSGPAGLAAADLLNRMGHGVTVFETAGRPGGLLMYGIPNMKLPKEIVERRIRLMEAEGVRFCPNVRADAETIAPYDAAVLCAGARKPRPLDAEGLPAGGVHFAVDYLSRATQAVLAGGRPEAEFDARGKHVVVVGGGDTGNDCVGTCLRQGCASVVELELLPAPPETRPADTPWPQWPRTLRTDYGQIECAARYGADPRRFETTVQAVLRDGGGNVKAVRVAKVARGANGRFQPVEGTQDTLPCEMLLIAAGFLGCDEENQNAFGLALTPRGAAQTIAGTHRIAQNLFAAGDVRTGQSLVVRAIADGRAAAGEVDAYLCAAR